MNKTIAALAGAALAFISAPAAAAPVVETRLGDGFFIFDFTSNTSTISVAETGAVTGVTFSLLGLGHTYIGDLFGTLEHNGTTFQFLNRTGGGSDLFGGYTFSDDGATTLPGAPGAVKASGTYRGFDLLSSFNGLDAAGAWNLNITDAAGADVGGLGGWSLTFTRDAAAGAVPEPATWALMMVGFGAIGHTLRRRQKSQAAALAA